MLCPSRRIHPARPATAPDESGGSGVLTTIEESCIRLRDAPLDSAETLHDRRTRSGMLCETLTELRLGGMA